MSWNGSHRTLATQNGVFPHFRFPRSRLQLNGQKLLLGLHRVVVTFTVLVVGMPAVTCLSRKEKRKSFLADKARTLATKLVINEFYS